MAVIASEMVAAQSGLGYFIQINRLLLLSDKVIAGMLIIGLIGFAMNHAFHLLGRVLVPWTPIDG
jgi:ABC-type nitrate/sulfonate/bicarbonate transport system permease component